MASGFCNFCQTNHSGGCCHPGRAQLATVVAKLEEITTSFNLTRLIMVDKVARDMAGKMVEEARAVIEKAKEV